MINVNNFFEQNYDKYKIYEKYNGKKILYEKVESRIYEFISEYLTKSDLFHLREEGLACLHKYLEVDKVHEIVSKFNKGEKKYIYEGVVDFVRNQLNYKESFFIDPGIVIRINYPIEIAEKSKIKEEDVAIYKSTKFVRFIKKLKNKILKKNDADFELRKKYHKDMPFLARAHGPHLDTWYGHSFDGLNLWWTLSGVNEENGLVFYPNSYGYDLPHEVEPVYIKENSKMCKPEFLKMPAGGMCVLNPEMLHATKINTSNFTRFAFTVRIIPDVQMSFNNNVKRTHDTMIFVDNNGSSTYVEKKLTEEQIGNQGAKRALTSPYIQKTMKIILPSGVKKNTLVKICNLDEIVEGVPYEYFSEEKYYFLIRSKNDIFSYRSECPHLGIKLVDGYFDVDELTITCPGHGLRFDMKNHESKCGKYKLTKDEILIVENEVFRKF